MSIAAMNWAWRQDVPSTPKLVLLALADAADDEGRCWPSVATLSIKASASTRTVRRAIQLLIDHSMITVEPRYRHDGSCSSNTYRLTMQGGDKLSPAPDRADRDPGHGCQGPPDTCVIPRTTNRTQKEPPQPQTESTDLGDQGGGCVSDLEYPKKLLPAERAEAESMIGVLATPLDQQVLDEWAGIIHAGAIRASPLGCLRALIKRAQQGKFTPERALGVAQARKAQLRTVARAQTAVASPKLGPINQENPLVKRITGLSKRTSRE
jgi:hypothetical protein